MTCRSQILPWWLGGSSIKSQRRQKTKFIGPTGPNTDTVLIGPYMAGNRLFRLIFIYSAGEFLFDVLYSVHLAQKILMLFKKIFYLELLDNRIRFFM
jgi:hypothetical protein